LFSRIKSVSRTKDPVAIIQKKMDITAQNMLLYKQCVKCIAFEAGEEKKEATRRAILKSIFILLKIDFKIISIFFSIFK